MDTCQEHKNVCIIFYRVIKYERRNSSLCYELSNDIGFTARTQMNKFLEFCGLAKSEMLQAHNYDSYASSINFLCCKNFVVFIILIQNLGPSNEKCGLETSFLC
jgi:hypothetical protein